MQEFTARKFHGSPPGGARRGARISQAILPHRACEEAQGNYESFSEASIASTTALRDGSLRRQQPIPARLGEPCAPSEHAHRRLLDVAAKHRVQAVASRHVDLHTELFLD